MATYMLKNGSLNIIKKMIAALDKFVLSFLRRQ
jgi:hypothetical protein